LNRCGLPGDAGCRNAFVECLQSDRGPTQLKYCRIDPNVLANAPFTGNPNLVWMFLSRNADACVRSEEEEEENGEDTVAVEEAASAVASDEEAENDSEETVAETRSKRKL
jgi:hypothetical protein